MAINTRIGSYSNRHQSMAVTEVGKYIEDFDFQNKTEIIIVYTFILVDGCTIGISYMSLAI